jgi:hypothetical protein
MVPDGRPPLSCVTHEEGKQAVHRQPEQGSPDQRHAMKALVKQLARQAVVEAKVTDDASRSE